MTFDNFDPVDLQQLVVKRPNLFVGRAWDREGLTFLVAELVRSMVNPDTLNAPTSVTIEVNRNHRLVIQDNGRGLPVDAVRLHNGEPAPRIEHQLTGYMERHPNRAYYAAFGFADYLVTVTNFVSASFVLYTVNAGTVYKIATSAGKVIERLHPTTEVQMSAGTRIDFKPAPSVFGGAELDLNHLAASIHQLSERHPSVKFALQVSFLHVV